MSGPRPARALRAPHRPKTPNTYSVAGRRARRALLVARSAADSRRHDGVILAVPLLAALILAPVSSLRAGPGSVIRACESRAS